MKIEFLPQDLRKRRLCVSKATLGKVYAGKLLSQVACWLGTMFLLSHVLQKPNVTVCTYSAVSPFSPAN